MASMNTSMKLMNEFHDLWSSAVKAEAYEQAMAYSTAEDLADALLKGVAFRDGAEQLILAFESNFMRAGEAEAEVWHRCIALVRAELRALDH